MLGELEYIDEDEWTSAPDDIDRYQISEKIKFMPVTEAM
jgi:hypothetical protein